MPAPVGGWNAYDSLANMDDDQAVILENYLPKESEVVVRNGIVEHVTHAGAPDYKSIMSYDDGVNKKILIGNSDGVYDATASQTTPTLLSAATDGEWQSVNFATPGGHFMPMVNGVDDYRYYNGTVVTTPVLVGVTASDLINITSHKRRLFFVIKNSLTFGFLPVDSISGTVSTFDLGSLCKHGGQLVAIGSWSIDAGDGVDDLAVFITSNGEVVVYQGSDPGTATDWTLVGVYKIGSPLGRRCMFDYAGELVIITNDGYVEISKAILGSRTRDDVLLSRNIQPEVRSQTSLYPDLLGWKGVFYPRGGMLLFNVPGLNSTSVQHVQNTNTKAWCKFTRWDSDDMTIHNDRLYVVKGNRVGLADEGFSDYGEPIVCDALTAFSYFGTGSKLKSYKMVRPILKTGQPITPIIDVNVDYDILPPKGVANYSEVESSPWDTSPWDTSPWGGRVQIKTEWLSANRIGYSAALRMKIVKNDSQVSWISTDWILESGGFL